MTEQRISKENTAEARWADTSPRNLNEQQWALAEPIFLQKYWSGEKAPADRQADARALWNDEGLFVLFRCVQREALVVGDTPQTSRKVIGLWDRDVCEVFLAPGQATPCRYFEFEAAPNGEWLDIRIRLTAEGRISDWEFKSGMSVTASVEPDRVLISMFIPWSSEIPKPSAGDAFRANFFRCVGSGEQRGYLAWQPTFTEEPSFHVPEAFGWLRFEK